jgi:hypothetical protein
VSEEGPDFTSMRSMDGLKIGDEGNALNDKSREEPYEEEEKDDGYRFGDNSTLNEQNRFSVLINDQPVGNRLTTRA